MCQLYRPIYQLTLQLSTALHFTELVSLFGLFLLIFLIIVAIILIIILTLSRRLILLLINHLGLRTCPPRIDCLLYLWLEVVLFILLSDWVFLGFSQLLFVVD